MYEVGRSYSAGSLLSKTYRRKEGGTRIGIVVSSKVSKKAVVRNKIRRQIKEILRKSKLVKTTGFDIIISARPSVVGRSFAQISEDCTQIINRYTQNKTKNQ